MPRALAFALIVLCALSARAQADDYDNSTVEWNGLGRLIELARGQGCDVTRRDRLIWSEINARDSVWILYPKRVIDASDVGRHLARGGSILIADDFGASDGVLRALGIERQVLPLVEVEHLSELDHLAVAHAEHRTHLGRSTDRVVANHPAVFTSAPVPPTFAFRPGAALVVEGHLGEGHFVALADSSVLINNMLDLETNRDFATGLVDTLCPRGSRALLFASDFPIEGSAGSGAAPSRFQLSAFVADADRALDKQLAQADSARLIALISLALATASIAASVLRRGGRPDGRWLRITPTTNRGPSWPHKRSTTPRS